MLLLVGHTVAECSLLDLSSKATASWVTVCLVPLLMCVLCLLSKAAARLLQEVANEFQEEENVIIAVAKKMSQQMFQMAEFSRGRGELQVVH